jgi:hypothetical protein
MEMPGDRPLEGKQHSFICSIMIMSL